MIRWTITLFGLAALLAVVRHLLIFLREPAQRERLACELGALPGALPVEEALEDWRRRFGRFLWINLVGIPIAIFLTLILIGEFA